MRADEVNRAGTGPEMAREKNSSRERSGNYNFESGKIDILKKSQGKLN